MRESGGTAVLQNEEKEGVGKQNPADFLLSRIQLSIVVTVFSETFSIRETVEILLGRDRGYIREVILLISPRASEEAFAVCRECAALDPRVKIQVQKNNPGIGWAYREGMQAATGNFVALMSADLETEPAAVDRMVDKILQTGCDGVIANRWLPGGGFTNYDPIKLVLNWIFQKMFMLLFWTSIGDLTFGFKILSKKVTDSDRVEGNDARNLYRNHGKTHPAGFSHQADCFRLGGPERGTQRQHVPQEFSIRENGIPNPCRQVMASRTYRGNCVQDMSHCSDDDPSSRDPE